MRAIPSPLLDSLGGRYDLERELGRGGMAIVYLARDVRHNRAVAVKVLDPDLSASLGSARFLREVETAARLVHPHVVPVHDSGEVGGHLFFVMPFVEGETLRARLDRERTLSLEEAIRIVSEIADALDYAHEQGVVHRDIKPENVLLSRGHALVADFGVARAISKATEDAPQATLTQTGLAVGTPAYMSPEQAAGERAVDRRSDVYSLGCVAYEMLAGVTPFSGTSAEQMAQRFRDGAPPITRRRADLPGGLDVVLGRALALAPSDRFSTAGEFATAFADAAKGKTALGNPERAQRVEVRNRRVARRLLLFGGGVALMGAALVAGRWIAANRELEDRSTAARKMLAVLPFKNLGQAADQYFADGITEEITSRLAGISGLGVISRTSADQYRNSAKPLKQIATELGVEYMLEGSIRWDRTAGGPGRVRVTPQLIRVQDDTHLWADQFEAELTDVFRVQQTVGERVAGALEVRLTEPERRALGAQSTSNADAYDQYLRGLGHARDASNPMHSLLEKQRSGRLATAYYSRAVELDPNFAIAHARLATALWAEAEPPNNEPLVRGRAALAEAERLAPDLPETLVASTLYFEANADRPRRIRDALTRAVARRPSDPDLLMALAWAQITDLNEVETGFSSIARAVRLDPRSVSVLSDAAALAKDYRRAAEAETYANRLITVLPEEPGGYDVKVQNVLIGRGDTARTRRLLDSLDSHVSPQLRWLAYPHAGLEYRRRFRQLTPAGALDWRDTSGFYRGQAIWAVEAGEWDRARAYYDSARVVVVNGLEHEGDTYPTVLQAIAHAELAVAYAGLGRREDALAEISRAETLAPFAKRELSGRHIPARLASAYALLGIRDSTITQLDRLLATPSGFSAAYLRIAPGLKSVRNDPRFRRLVEDH